MKTGNFQNEHFFTMHDKIKRMLFLGKLVLK